jgi:hypothetical protein
MNKINNKYQIRFANQKAGLRDGIQKPNTWMEMECEGESLLSVPPVWKIMPFDCDAAN